MYISASMCVRCGFSWAFLLQFIFLFHLSYSSLFCLSYYCPLGAYLSFHKRHKKNVSIQTRGEVLGGAAEEEVVIRICCEKKIFLQNNKNRKGCDQNSKHIREKKFEMENQGLSPEFLLISSMTQSIISKCCCLISMALTILCSLFCNPFNIKEIIHYDKVGFIVEYKDGSTYTNQ